MDLNPTVMILATATSRRWTQVSALTAQIRTPPTPMPGASSSSCLTPSGTASGATNGANGRRGSLGLSPRSASRFDKRTRSETHLLVVPFKVADSLGFRTLNAISFVSYLVFVSPSHHQIRNDGIVVILETGDSKWNTASIPGDAGGIRSRQPPDQV